jgi:hypothetical protein
LQAQHVERDWSEFRRQPLPFLNPKETDPAGALAKADKQELKTDD